MYYRTSARVSATAQQRNMRFLYATIYNAISADQRDFVITVYEGGIPHI